jgi:predicted SAM-dependent methyltransferase
MNTTYLNLGCEFNKLPGWLNIDINETVKPDRVADARDLWFIPDMSVQEILASHLLEHFYESEVIPALREWNRVLIPGGRINIIVPDVQKVAGEWLSGLIGDQTVLKGFIGDNQEKSPYMVHKTFFWWSRLSLLLSENNYDRILEINKRPGLLWLDVLAYRKI